MTNDTIKLDLPLVPGVLKRAAAMLLGVADDIVAAGPEITGTLETIVESPPAPAASEEIDTTAVGFGAGTEDPPPPAGTEDPPPPAGTEDPPPPPSDVTLDKDDLPWDGRIHGSGKTFLKTGIRAGCWKYARNLEEGLVEKVEAELKAAMAAVPPAPALLTAEDPGLTINPPPPPPAPPAPGAALDFPGIVQKVTGLINEGRLTADQVTAILTPLGLASLPLVASRPDLIPSIDLEINKLCPPTP